MAAGNKYMVNEMFDVAGINKFLSSVDAQIIQIDKHIKKLSNVSNTGKGFKELNTINEKSNKIKIQTLKFDKKAVELQKQRDLQNKKYIQSLTKLQKQKERQLKIDNQTNLQAQKRIQKEKLLVATIRKRAREEAILQQETKEMLILQKKEIKSDRELIRLNTLLAKSRSRITQTNKKSRKQYQLLTRQIQKNEIAIRKSGKSIGRFQRNVGNYASSLKGSIGMMIGGAGIYGMIRLLGNIGNIFKTFEKDVKRLQSIIGTGVDISGLTQQAKDLGAITQFTAREIIALQTELAKLGFSSQAILDSTEGIQGLAAATGIELATAATIAGSALKIFGLDASEAGRVADVLALSTSKSALDMEKLAVALPYVGTSAKIAGKSIEWTTSRLGILVDRGIQASTAGTSLRKMFGELAKKGIDYNDALEMINNSSNKSKTAIELFGLKAKDAAIILAENVTQANELETALDNASGAAQDMADVMLDNLAGDITLTKSAWEGFILSVEDGNGVISQAVRGTVLMFGQLLKKLTQINKYGQRVNDNLEEQSKTRISNLKKVLSYEHQRVKIARINLAVSKREAILEKIKGKGIEFIRNEATQDRIVLLQKEIEELKELSENEDFLNTVVADGSGILKENTDELNKNTDASNENNKTKSEGRKVTKELKEQIEDLNKSFEKGSAITEKYKNNIQEIIKGITGKGITDKVGKKEKTGFLERIFGIEDENERELIIAKAKELKEALSNLVNEYIEKEKAAAEEEVTLHESKIQNIQDEITAAQKKNEELEAMGAAYDNNEIQRLQNKLQAEALLKEKALAKEKEIKKKEKLMKITTAVINTAVGVTSALALTPPASYILAALTAALGLVEIATIQSAQYYDGTKYLELGNNPKGKDTIPIMAHEGERIVPPYDNAKIPRTFPNSEIPIAIDYYMNAGNDYNSNESVGNDNLTLNQIEKNTRPENKIYSNGVLKRENFENMIVYYE